MRFLFGFLSFFSVAAFADTQSYRIEWFPGSDVDCERDIAAIGEKFSAVTGLAVKDTLCERPFTWKLDAVVRYEADYAANLVSTYDELSLRQGLYSDFASCSLALDGEIRLFRTKTGLTPVVAFCFARSKPNAENRYPYVARVESFGNPSIKPVTFQKSFYAEPMSSAEQLFSVINSALRQMPGVENPRIRLDTRGAAPGIVIQYYSTRSRPIMLESFATFESRELCIARQAAIGQKISEFGVLGITNICAGQKFSANTKLYHFGLVTGAFAVRPSPNTFTSRETCEQHLAEGPEKVGGFCSYGDDLNIFSDEFVAKLVIEQ